MPMVEYFDRASGTKKRKEFAYGAVGKENFRKFKEEQDAFAKAHGHAKPKVSHPVKSNSMEGEKHTDTKKGGGPGVGVKPKESLKDKEKRHQDYDQKELDKNKPSEAKTPKKEKVYLQKKKDPDKKTTVSYGGPGYLGMWSG